MADPAVEIPTASLSNHDKSVLESIFNPSLPFDGTVESSAEKDNVNESCTVSQQLIDLEVKGMNAAENGDLEEALEIFTKAIDMDSSHAANYNNRAQVHRLKGDLVDAKKDLDAALLRSGGHGTAACQAYCQRAMIRRLEGDESGCKEDFKKAAVLGSKFAAQQLVSLNPYAALCNSMLSEMFAKLQRGEPENSGHPAA